MADGGDLAAAIVAQAALAEVDEVAFRQAMARLAGGVAVVACQTLDGPRGLLVNSLITLSVDPARVLFCVRKEAAAHSALVRASDISVSVLADGHQEEAERFSQGRLADQRFDPAHWRLTPAAPPSLKNALIVLTGEREQLIDAGSHSMFIVRVRDAVSADRLPLVYFARAFHSLASHRLTPHTASA